jgi:hypothetical protein
MPSRPIHVIDVPEVNNFNSYFRYNFYTPDESLNDKIQLSKYISSKEYFEFENIDFQLLGKLPRFVFFEWQPVQLLDGTKNEQNIIKSSKKSQVKNDLIKKNYDNIISEDQVSSFNFCNIILNDSDIDKKTFNFISSSYDIHFLETKKDINENKLQMISNIKSIFDKKTDVDCFSNAISQNDLSYGILKRKENSNISSQYDLNGTEQKSIFFENLKKVKFNLNVNSKLASNLTEKSINDPFVPYGNDFFVLKNKLEEMKTMAIRLNGINLNEFEFRFNIKFIEVNALINTFSIDENQKEIIGYVIEKHEILESGEIKIHDPIIIENNMIHSAIDSNIKYNSRYIYSIKTIMLVNMPAINDETGEMAMVKFLVSSKPSENIYIETHEKIAPPPPTDINFVWNYDLQNIMIYWAFPPNSQRDIKRFQLFRRERVEHPFELIKEFNFDDSLSPMDNNENPAPKSIKRTSSPINHYYDDDFTKDSKYIYALCSVDAHGLTSNYSTQFEITFDKFKNQINKKLISHRGAPKPYPNIFLPGKGMLDVAHVNGVNSKKMFLYFIPQCYSVNDNGKKINVLETNKTNGSYKIHFINTDNQKSEIVDIQIEDRII